MNYVALDPRFRMEWIGYVPSFLSESDPRSAREQLNENYIGGWNPLPGWKFNKGSLVARYPGDPPLKPFALTSLHGEIILFYPHEQVAIVQPDGSFEIARMD